MFSIRDVIPESDFWRLPDLLNVARPEPITMDALYRWHFREAEGRIQERIVAESESGALVGYGSLSYEPYLPQGEMTLWVMTAATHVGRGIGRALYDHLYQIAQAHGATVLTSEVLDNNSPARAWAERRGFHPQKHMFASRLTLATFDPAPFADVVAKAQARGIRFMTMADFPDDLTYREWLYALNRETGLEIPNNSNPYPPFDAFQRDVLESDWYRAEGQFLALDGEEWVGLSAIRYLPESNSMYNNMTGVRSGYRGRGIAMALKLLGIEYAKKMGAAFIRTHNDSSNAPMLAINQKLGYEAEVGFYWLKRE